MVSIINLSTNVVVCRVLGAIEYQNIIPQGIDACNPDYFVKNSMISFERRLGRTGAVNKYFIFFKHALSGE